MLVAGTSLGCTILDATEAAGEACTVFEGGGNTFGPALFVACYLGRDAVVGRISI